MAIFNPETQKDFTLITGASSGIGFELAKVFAKNGHDLLITAEDLGIEKATDRLKKIGTKVECFRVDLATYKGVESLVQWVSSYGRPIQNLAINAGVGVGGDFVRSTDLQAELNMIQLNISSSVHLSKRIVKTMVQRSSGRVLFTSSLAATAPGPFEAVYAASKAFLLSFSEALREELDGTGVTITALLPGATETNFFRRAGMQDTRIGSSKKDDPALVAKEAYDALMSGRHRVIAGSVKNKFLGLTDKLLPDPLKAKIHRGLSEPKSMRN